MDPTSHERPASLALANHPIPKIREELDYLCSNFTKKINVDMHQEDKTLQALYNDLGGLAYMRHKGSKLQALWNRVGGLAYKAEFLIESLLVEGVPDSHPMLFNSVVEELEIIRMDAVNISDSKGLHLDVMGVARKCRLHLDVMGVARKCNFTSSQQRKAMINNVIVGLEDEADSIINRLTRGSSRLQIVPITGMGGLGKTTLASKVYNDPRVKSHFDALAWCCISDVFHKKCVLREILCSICIGKPKTISGTMSEEDLCLEVKGNLLQKRYFIVLDDVWDIEVWNYLKLSFPDNQNGSRAVLTSRNHDIVSRGELNEGAHHLRKRNHGESWDLLIMMLYHGKRDSPSTMLCKLREQILEMCRGLPLAIVILAGILANREEYHWEEVLKTVHPSTINDMERLMVILELSYQSLPDYLKPYFLYFGAFPDSIEDLSCLWVAEGFAQEDVTKDYMMYLIDRGLVMYFKKNSIDEFKVCVVHNLLHVLCVTKDKEENFFQCVHGYEEPYSISVPYHLCRLCINYNSKNFYKFRLFAPAIRSISDSVI